MARGCGGNPRHSVSECARAGGGGGVGVCSIRVSSSRCRIVVAMAPRSTSGHPAASLPPARRRLAPCPSRRRSRRTCEGKGANGRTRCRWCSGRRSAAISGISSTEIFDGDYAGVKGGTVEEGVGVEAPWEWLCVLVFPTGPVSPEIRLTRWCRALIINEPNFIM